MNRRGAGHWSRILVIDGPQSFREFLLDGHGRHRTKFPHQASRRLVGLNQSNLDLFTAQKPCLTKKRSSAVAPEPSEATQATLDARAQEPNADGNRQRTVLPLLPFSPPRWCAPQQIDAASNWKFPVIEEEAQ
jgi:hypothetical protein